MHYRQLTTLDIGNNALLCKVFPASLQGQTLSWFHRLPMNSVDNFQDLSEAFVGQYLCSMWHRQNISTLQNIKMQENESLRKFMKRFGQVVLQVESYSMDVVLQIFKRSICLGTQFFESLAKPPPPWLWTTCSGVQTNIQCLKMMYAQLPNRSWLPDNQPGTTRQEIPDLRINKCRPAANKASKVSRSRHRLHPLPCHMRSFFQWSVSCPNLDDPNPSKGTNQERLQ